MVAEHGWRIAASGDPEEKGLGCAREGVPRGLVEKAEIAARRLDRMERERDGRQVVCR